MEITLNENQRLFVFVYSDHVSCLGFDVVYDHCRELERRIKRLRLLAAGVQLVPVREEDIGTLHQYEQYQALWKIVGTRKIGTWFAYETPSSVRNVLERYRKEGGRLRLFYGDRKTGRSWLDEHDMVGKIGRSMGPMQIPLLMTGNDGGGFGILDSCIVRLIDADTREELYRLKNFHLPEMEIRPVGDQLLFDTTQPTRTLASMGYTHGVWVKDTTGHWSNQSHHKSFGSAAQYVAFMSGDCMEQPA